jgi:hypothetical protein
METNRENLTLTEADLAVCRPVMGAGGHVLRAVCPFHGATASGACACRSTAAGACALPVGRGAPWRRHGNAGRTSGSAWQPSSGRPPGGAASHHSPSLHRRAPGHPPHTDRHPLGSALHVMLFLEKPLYLLYLLF